MTAPDAALFDIALKLKYTQGKSYHMLYHDESCMQSRGGGSMQFEATAVCVPKSGQETNSGYLSAEVTVTVLMRLCMFLHQLCWQYKI